MFERLPSFRVGELYSNKEIHTSLEVGNAGGIRSRVADGDIRRLVIMTALPDTATLSENPYHDRREGNILVYTAAGRHGDQSLNPQNAKIARQVDSCFPIWGFQLQSHRRDKNSGPRRWKFLGLLEYVRSYVEPQIDSNATLRTAYVFELFIHDQHEEFAVELDAISMAEIIGARPPEARIDESDREVDLPILIPHPGGSSFGSTIEQVRKSLLSQSPQQFEHVIGNLLIHTGFRDVEVTRYSQDGGIDINARPSHGAWPMRHLLLQIQAKRWMHTVGRREVAELRGSILPYSAGCIVTTGHFSKAAIVESVHAGKCPISLVSGSELAGLILESGLNLE